MKKLRKTPKHKKGAAILRRLLLLIVSFILGINVYLWNARSLAGNSLPMPFGFGVAVVLSGSMEPVLSVDDLILIKETDKICPGDIVVYQSGRELIVHRVVSIDGETVLTKGDANNVADEPFDVSNVKGKMVGHLPWMGKIVRCLKTPAGIIGVLAAAFALTELSYRRERKKDTEDIEKIKEEIRRLKEEQDDRK